MRLLLKRTLDGLLGPRLRRDLQFGLRVTAQHFFASLSPSQPKRIPQLRSRRDLKLHLGCGPNCLQGWLNADIIRRSDIRLDLRRGLPFSDCSAIYTFSEHLLEHLDVALEVPFFLSECHRPLRPGGTMRVVVPDAKRFVHAYSRNNLKWFGLVEPSRHWGSSGQGLAFNFLYHGQHRSGWDYRTLALSRRPAGVSQIQRTEYRNGPIAELNGVRDLAMRAAHSLCVNAGK